MTGEVHFKKLFFFGGRVYIFSCDSSSGAPHEAHICKGHSGSVGAGAPCSVCRPPGASRKFRYYREPHFVCGNMYSLNIPCWKNMIGAMSCSVCTVHLYFCIGIGKGEGDVRWNLNSNLNEEIRQKSEGGERARPLRFSNMLCTYCSIRSMISM